MGKLVKPFKWMYNWYFSTKYIGRACVWHRIYGIHVLLLVVGWLLVVIPKVWVPTIIFYPLYGAILVLEIIYPKRRRDKIHAEQQKMWGVLSGQAKRLERS